jgi:hypothetical protein
MREARRLGWLLWPAALEGVCGCIVVAITFVALGHLHPAFVLPLIALAILGALARPAFLRNPGEAPPARPADRPEDAAFLK